MTDERASSEPIAVLDEYDAGALREIARAGGTAGRTWRVSTATGDYFLRRRGTRTSTPARLAFDHGLREHLIARGIPTACAIPCRNGERWVSHQGYVYELYPFVPGRPFHPGNLDEIRAAARSLACFHLAAADYTPPRREDDPVAQYTSLGFSDRVSDRMDDPDLQELHVLRVRDLLAKTDQERQLMDRCLSRVCALKETYAGAAYARLAGWVIHGDYTPANLLYSQAGQVVGIFDFDWAMPGPRCLDVARGLYFFASEPREIRSGDIWSLTAAARFWMEGCVAFLAAYQHQAPLESTEIDAIPYAFAGEWLSIRLEGMAKVPPERRFEFFSRGIEQPLAWLDAHWADLRGWVA